jgi:hypothetical protein
MKYVSTIIAVAATAAALAAARAQPVQHHDQGESANAADRYAPGLGEIMSFQQMRHSKLWFAGRVRNWALAGYELDELKEGFDDVVKYAPTHDGVELKPAVEAITQREIADLDKAIKAQDRAAFTAGFDRLTAACNACHQTAKHAFIVIQRPRGLPYTNQTFAPARQARSPAADNHHR